MGGSRADTDGQIPDHSHCRICGKVIPFGRAFCSSEHELEHARGRKQLERMQRVFSVLMVTVAALFVLTIVVQAILR